MRGGGRERASSRQPRTWRHHPALHVHVLHTRSACFEPRSLHGSDAVRPILYGAPWFCMNTADQDGDMSRPEAKQPTATVTRGGHRCLLQDLMCLVFEGMGHPGSHLCILDPLSRAASQHEAEDNRKEARTSPRRHADQLQCREKICK